MDLNILTYLGIMLLAALIAGKIVKQMRLPNVTGYLVIGLLIGPNCLKLLSEELIDHMDLVTELALGCIAFSIGAEFKMSFLKKVGKAPIVIGITEGMGAVFVVDTILLLLGYDVSFALALGAIASATAAASTMMIVKQYKTKGPVTNTLLPVVALDDAVALVAYGLSMAVANVISSSGSAPVGKLLIAPCIEIFGGLLFGAVLGVIMTLLVKVYTGRGNRLAITIMMICLCVGISDMVGFSSLLACMMLSTIFANISKQSDKIYEPLERITPPIYMMFFYLVGCVSGCDGYCICWRCGCSVCRRPNRRKITWRGIWCEDIQGTEDRAEMAGPDSGATGGCCHRTCNLCRKISAAVCRTDPDNRVVWCRNL